MFGAIIGDLAADTYLRNKDIFYNQLIDEEAHLSELSLSVLWAANFANENPYGHFVNDKNGFIKFLKRNNGNAKLSKNAKRFIDNQESKVYRDGLGMYLMRIGTFSFWSDEIKDCLYERKDKEEMYSEMALSKMLQLLYKGWTKDEVWINLNAYLLTAINIGTGEPKKGA